MFIIDSGAKTPKRPGIVAPHLGGEILADADGLGGVLGAGVEPQPRGGGERHHRGADAILVHQFDELGRRPVEHPGIGRDVTLALPFLLQRQIGRRIEMMVRVDQKSWRPARVSAGADSVAAAPAAPRPARNWRRDERAEEQAGQWWNSMDVLPILCLDCPVRAGTAEDDSGSRQCPKARQARLRRQN